MLGMAGHDRTDDDLFHARALHVAQLLHGGDVLAGLEQHLAALTRHCLEQAAANQVLVQIALLVLDGVRHALVGAAVDLAHDDVLRHVHQTAGQVTRVGGTQSGVSQALTGAVRGDEVLEHRQALAEVRLDGTVDDLALRVGHEAAHAGELADLLDVTASTGERHHVDGVELVEVLGHRVADLFVGLVPDVDDLLVALLVADEAQLVVVVDGGHLRVSLRQDLALGRRDGGVVDRHGDARARGVVEAGVLQAVEDRRQLGQLVGVAHILHQAADLLLVHLVVQEGVVGRQHVVEDDASDRRLDAVARLVLLVHAIARSHLHGHAQAHLDLRLQVEVGASIVGAHGVVDVGEHAALALETVAGGGQVVQADDHVLRRHRERAAMCRALDVVRRQHEHARLSLSLSAERHVHSHLVAIEVGVEGGADQRMQADGLALHQHRLECLDAEAVQGWRAVQQHRMIGDDLFQHVPHAAGTAVDLALRVLDVIGVFQLHQALDDERLEQLQRHLAGQAALVQLQLRAHHDDRTAGVVDALAQQVLAEAALLALQHVADGLQRAVAGARDRAAAAAVVEQAVHSLLEHALLVVHDDLGRTQIEQALQAVVAVDDAAVQVVQVGGGETAAVQLHHRAQVGRDDRHHVQDHVRGIVVALQERVDHLQALRGLHALLALAGADDLTQLLGGGLQVDLLEQVAHGLGAHAALEVVAVVGAHLAVERLVGHQLLRLYAHELVQRVSAQRLALVELLVDVSYLLLHLFRRQAVVVIGVVHEVVVFGHVIGRELAGGLD